VHYNGILHTMRVPGCIAPGVAELAIGMAQRVTASLDYVGGLAVDFFFATDGQLFINEMAPRPHNSGHYTRTPARSRNSNSRCARCVVCRRVRRACCRR